MLLVSRIVTLLCLTCSNKRTYFWIFGEGLLRNFAIPNPFVLTKPKDIYCLDHPKVMNIVEHVILARIDATVVLFFSK